MGLINYKPKFLVFKVVTFAYICSNLYTTGFANKYPKEAEIASHIEKLAAGFPLTRFETDPELTQKIDSTNSISKYNLIGDTAFLFERNSNDKNKEVVVLTAEEDKIPFNKFKRIYVVLRKKPAGDNYYATLAFLRNSNGKDGGNVVEIEGTKLAVEWGTFDDHIIPGRTALTHKTLQCVSSFLVPCSFPPESALTQEFIKSPHYVYKPVSQASIDEIESQKAEVEGGVDPLDNVDLYADLDMKRTEGRYLFGGAPEESGVGVIGGLLAGVGGVICGVMSILASCADERAYNNVMPWGIAAQTALAQNPVWQGPPPPQVMYGRKKRQDNGQDSNQLDYPGWKTQFLTPKKDVTFKTQELFYGFGNCPYIPKTAADFKNAATKIQLVDFYLIELRAQCIPWMRELLEKIVDSGILNVKGQILELNPVHLLLNEQKLTLRELLLLESALELDAFTKIYVEESTNPSAEVKSPDYKRIISKSIKFIVNVGLKSLERIIEQTKHTVHLSRHMLHNFKAIYTKLKQDAQNLERCTDDCSHDKEINFNDRLQVKSLIHFIKFGLGAVKSSSEIKSHYKNFYSKNINTVEKLVNINS